MRDTAARLIGFWLTVVLVVLMGIFWWSEFNKPTTTTKPSPGISGRSTAPLPDPWGSTAVPAPPDAPPQHILVGPFHYTVEFRTHAAMPGEFGVTDVNTHRILLRNDMEPGLLRECLTHELIHAVIALGNARQNVDGSTEDEFIESSAPGLVMVIRDNPELVRWLRGRAK